MMQRYSGDFLDAIDGLRALLGCRGRVWPVSVQQASVCAEYGDGSVTRGEVEVDAGQSSGRFVSRIWLEPPVVDPSGGREGDRRVRRGDHRTGQLLHEPDADLPRAAASPRRCRTMKGPVILVANLLTEGRGMVGFTAADAVARIEDAIQRPVDVVITNTEVAVAEDPRPLRARAQGAARARRTCRPTASWSAASSGPARSPGTIACGSPTRSGACCRGGCSRRNRRQADR